MDSQYAVKHLAELYWDIYLNYPRSEAQDRQLMAVWDAIAGMVGYRATTDAILDAREGLTTK